MAGQHADWVGGIYSAWMYNFDFIHCNATIYVGEGNTLASSGVNNWLNNLQHYIV